MYGAGFFTFWSLGFIVDVMQPVVNPPLEVIGTAVLTGLTAVLFIYVAAFHKRWFPALIVAMLFFFLLPITDARTARMKLSVVGSLGALLAVCAVVPRLIH